MTNAGLNNVNYSTTVGTRTSATTGGIYSTNAGDWVIPPDGVYSTTADYCYTNTATVDRMALVEMELKEIKKMIQELLREKLLLDKLRK